MSFFRNKVIWITGASSGIGAALAMALAKHGARLVLSARREGELQKVARATGLSINDCLVLPFDLLDTSRAVELVKQITERFSRIDVLISNGGVSQRAEAMETNDGVARQIMEINYFASVNLARAVTPVMLRQGSGQIVVISSIAGKLGFFLRSSYSAAKHALHGYFESYRLEMQDKGIKVTLVCPGKIQTAISLHAVTGDGSRHAKMDKSHVHAMSAEQCANRIVTAMIANKREVYIGGKEIWLIYIRRFFPGLFNWIVRRQKPF